MPTPSHRGARKTPASGENQTQKQQLQRTAPSGQPEGPPVNTHSLGSHVLSFQLILPEHTPSWDSQDWVLLLVPKARVSWLGLP